MYVALQYCSFTADKSLGLQIFYSKSNNIILLKLLFKRVVEKCDLNKILSVMKFSSILSY